MLFLYLTYVEKSDAPLFEDIYTKYKSNMFYEAKRILGNDLDAEDAVHEAFIGIARHFSSLRDKSPAQVYAYVMAAARNAAINVYHSLSSHPYVIDLETLANIMSTDAIKDVESKNELVESMMSLPVIYRDVLTMYYLNGMSTREISDHFNISNATVRKRLSRAKEMLKKVIA